MTAETYTTFRDVDVPIIDADAHVQEPPHLWIERAPSRLKDRVPRVEHREDGDWWVFDDGKAVAAARAHGISRSFVRGVPPRRCAPRRAAAGHVRAQAPSRRSRCRRHLRAGAVPERHARGRQDLQRRPLSSRSSACAPTTSGSPSSARADRGACSRRRSFRPPASTTRSKSSSGPSSTTTGVW